MNIKFLGATREVTDSCYFLQVNNKNILLECGMLQGSYEHEGHNCDPLPFDVADLERYIRASTR